MEKYPSTVIRFFFRTIWIIMLVYLCGCKKPDPPEIVLLPLKYSGTWTGTTNTMGFISLTSSNIDNRDWITGFKLELNPKSGGAFHEERVNGGISVVSGDTFIINPQCIGFLKGHFLSDALGYGTYKMYNNLLGDTVIGNYLINHSVKGISLCAHAQFSTSIGDTNIYIGQEINTIKTDAIQELRKGYLTFSSWLKIKNQSTGVYDTLIKIKLSKLSSPLKVTDFQNLVRSGPVHYANQAQSGVEIIYYDQNDRLKRWSSAQGSAYQAGNIFRIKESELIDGTENSFLLYKIFAEFDCTLYDNNGNSQTLSNADYVGFFRCNTDMPK